jgi:uncharacterized protein
MTVLRVVVMFSPEPDKMDVSRLELPEGSTIAQAVAASGVAVRYPQVDGLPVGIWGKKQSADTVLRDGDRVEIYRPLRCDPKEARRQRYRQRAHSAASANQQTKPGALTSPN